MLAGFNEEPGAKNRIQVFVGWFLVSSAFSGLVTRYVYGRGDLADYLLMAMRLTEPEFFASDWYLNTPSVELPRWVFVHALAQIGGVIGFPWAAFLVHLIAVWAGAAALYLIGEKLSRSANGGFLLVMLSIWFISGVGSSAWQPSGYGPKGIALAFALWSLYFCVISRHWTAIFLACCAIQFHMVFGGYFAFVIAAAQFVREKKSREFLLSLVCIGSAAAPWAIAGLLGTQHEPAIDTAASMELGRFVGESINIQLGLPSDPLLWVRSFVYLAAMFAWAVRSRDETGRLFAAIASIAAALVILGAISLKLFPVYFMVLLNFIRNGWILDLCFCLFLVRVFANGAPTISTQKPYGLWLGIVTLVGWRTGDPAELWCVCAISAGLVCLVIWQGADLSLRTIRRTSQFLLLFLAARFVWLLYRLSFMAMPEGGDISKVYFQVAGLLARPLAPFVALAVLAFGLRFMSSQRFLIVAATVWISVMGARYGAEQRYLNGPEQRLFSSWIRINALGETPTRPEEWVARWLRDHSPQKAVILAPPAIERLQILAKRSVVFAQNRVPFSSTSAMQEYRRRAGDFLPGGLESMEGSSTLELSRHLLVAYPHLSDERLLLLATRYKATHGIVTSDQLQDLPSLYVLNGWRAVRF